MNGALSMKARSRGLLVLFADSTLGFLFSTFAFDFGFWGMVIGSFF